MDFRVQIFQLGCASGVTDSCPLISWNLCLRLPSPWHLSLPIEDPFPLPHPFNESFPSIFYRPFRILMFTGHHLPQIGCGGDVDHFANCPFSFIKNTCLIPTTPRFESANRTCQMLPTLAAASGRQVEQLDAVMLPTDGPGPGREGGRDKVA